MGRRQRLEISELAKTPTDRSMGLGLIEANKELRPWFSTRIQLSCHLGYLL